MAYHLLSENTAKMLKSRELGYYSTILHLEPAYTYRGLNTCPAAGQCKAYCLGNSGRMRFDTARAARIRRTQLFVDNHAVFMTLLAADIASAQLKAARLGVSLTVRLNGTSDIAWELLPCNGLGNIFQAFPSVQFIDYTKISDRALTVSEPNYCLVYSHNEKSDSLLEIQMLKRGVNIATVFEDELPTGYKIGKRKYPVVDGDISDLRHLDPKGCIVGLRYKRAFSRKTGKSIKVKEGFVQIKAR